MLKETLAALTLSGVLIFGGCDNSEYIEGTVVKEAGTITQIVPSSGAMFGNESIKFSKPSYIIQIQTPQGLYTADIKHYFHQDKSLESMALVIEKGTKVKIQKSALGSSRFSEDKMGYLYTNEILVLGKEQDLTKE